MKFKEFLNEYNINEKTIYVDDQLICIKIMYMPSLQPIKNHQKIIDFVEQNDKKRIMEYHRSRRSDSGEAPRKYEVRFLDKWEK